MLAPQCCNSQADDEVGNAFKSSSVLSSFATPVFAGTIVTSSQSTTTNLTSLQPEVDIDLVAADLNGLSFQERQAVHDEIHGVADTVEETPDFLRDRLDAMRNAIRALRHNKRKAYDQAVHLRPTIGTDDSFHLICLRAKRWNPEDAAHLITAYFQSKLELFGESLLVQKITWEDLTPKERHFAMTGVYLPLKGQESRGRVLLYTWLSDVDFSDPLTTIRATWYINGGVIDDIELQNGAIQILDLRGSPPQSPLGIVNFFKFVQRHLDTLLYRIEGIHIIYDTSALDNFFKAFLSVLKKEFRIRHRFHFGSKLEIQYSLRTFGINIEDSNMSRGSGAFSTERIQKYFQERQRKEDAWRQREAPYSKPSSKFALYPNKNDILMGRHKIVMPWTGNSVYNKLIENQAPRYVAANSMNRVEKTLIAFQTIHVLQKEYGARFLIRRDDGWEAMQEADVQPRVSQLMRMAARSLTTTTGTRHHNNFS